MWKLRIAARQLKEKDHPRGASREFPGYRLYTEPFTRLTFFHFMEQAT